MTQVDVRDHPAGPVVHLDPQLRVADARAPVVVHVAGHHGAEGL